MLSQPPSLPRAARAITIRITIAITITITKSLHECRHHDISTLNDHGQHKLDYSAAAQTNVRQRDAQVYLRDMTQPILLLLLLPHRQPTMPSLAPDT